MKDNDSIAMLEDDIRHLKEKKRAADEMSARWLMKANDIDEKISRIMVKIAAKSSPQGGR